MSTANRTVITRLLVSTEEAQAGVAKIVGALDGYQKTLAATGKSLETLNAYERKALTNLIQEAKQYEDTAKYQLKYLQGLWKTADAQKNASVFDELRIKTLEKSRLALGMAYAEEQRLAAERRKSAGQGSVADDFNLSNVVKQAALGQQAMDRMAQAAYRLQQAQAAAAAKVDPFNLSNVVKQAAAGEAALERMAKAAYRTQQARANADPFNLSNVVKQAAAGEAALNKLAQANYRLQQAQAAAAAKANPFSMQNILALQQRTAGQTGSLYSQTSSSLSSRPTTPSPLIDPVPDNAILKSKGLLETINKLSFSIFVLTFGTQQLGEIFLRTFVQAGEKIEALRFRFEGLTNSTKTFDAIFKVAQDLGVGVNEVAGSFNRFAVANTALGLTNDKLIEMTRNIGALGLIGGGSAQEVASGMQQLGQSLASGVLQGDELRSIMENMPFLALKLAEGLNVPVGSLKKLGAAGELTSEKIANAFLKMTAEINRLMENIPVTSERGLARIANSWAVLVDQMLRIVGTDTVGEWFTGIADKMQAWGDGVEHNRVSLAGWIAAVVEAAKVLGGLLLAFQLWRSLSGLIAFFAGLKAQMLGMAGAGGVATTSLAKFNAATEGTAVAGLRTARVMSNMVTAFFPLAAVIVAAGAAWLAYSDAQKKASGAADEAVAKFKELDAAKLAALSRKEAVLGQTGSENKLARDAAALVDVQKKIDDVQARILFLNSVGVAPNFPGLVNFKEDLLALLSEDDRLTKSIEDSKKAAEGYEAQLTSQRAEYNATISTVERMSKVYKDLKKTLEEGPGQLRDLQVGLEMINKYGVEEGKKMQERQKAMDAYLKVVQDQMAKAKIDDPKVRVDARLAAIAEAKEGLDIQLKLLDAQNAYNDAANMGNRDYVHSATVALNLDKQRVERLTALLPIIDEMSKRYGVSRDILVAIANQESSFNMAARGTSGEYGIMQIMPNNIGPLSKKTGFTAQQTQTEARANIAAGASLLQKNIARAGNEAVGIRMYNGSGAAAENYSHIVMGMVDKLAAAGGNAASMWNKQREAAQASQEAIIAGTRDLLANSTDYRAKVAAMEQQHQLEVQKINDNEKLSAEAKSVSILAADARYYEAKRQMEKQTLAYSLETYQVELDARKTATTESERYAEEESRIRIDSAKRIADEQRKYMDGLITLYDLERRVAAEENLRKKQLVDLDIKKNAEWVDSASQSFGNFFNTLAQGGTSVKDTFKTLVTSLRDLAIQMLIMKPIIEAFKAAFNYTATGGNGSGFNLGGLASAFVGGLSGAPAAANGAVFQSSLPYGVYSAPTYFPISGSVSRAFATGTGLLGEAGPEAVLPLSRGANGKLGVSAQGGGRPVVNVTVNNMAQADVSTRQNSNGDIEVHVTPKQLNQIESHLANRMVQGGGNFNAAMGQAYGARRVGT